MKTTRTRSITMAALASTLAFSGVAGAFDAPTHPRTTRESVSSTGTPAVGTVLPGVISANGRYVVFTSTASNLIGVSGAHVYRHDRTAGTTVLVTVAKTGLPSVAGGFAPTVSADGRFVAFASASNDVVAGDTNGTVDVFLRDMVAGTTAMVSDTQTGAAGDLSSGLNSSAGAHEISDDGRYVAFTSNATNLVPTSNNGKQQVYVKDMLTGVVTRASVDGSNAAGHATSSAPTLSGNGRVVAFVSQAANFSLVSTSHTGQLFVRDLETATTTLESVTTAGAPTLSRPASAPALSFDGRYLAFESQAQLEPRDRDIGTWDVFLRDRALHTTTLASLSANPVAAADSRAPSISADGRWIGFQSLDDTLVGGDVNHLVDVFLYDRTTEAVTLVSQNDAGQQTNAPSTSPSVSSDGRLVLLMSSASNPITSPSSTGSQLYVRDMRTNEAPVVTLGADENLLEGVRLSRLASFSDQDASTSWSATVDYGDGSAGMAIALVGNSFVLDHTYGTAGAYTVTVNVTDSNGAGGSATLAVTVRKYTFQWHEPVESSFTVGRLIPVKFSVFRADGTPVLDTTVRVDVLDASGAVVVGYLHGGSPSGSVTWNGSDYHVDVDTRGFAPGDYTLRVSFSSPTLSGEFTKQATVTGTAATTTTSNDGKDKKDK